MSLCPCCGFKDAYIGFTKVECRNPECTNYNKVEVKAEKKEVVFEVGTVSSLLSGNTDGDQGKEKTDKFKEGYINLQAEVKDWDGFVVKDVVMYMVSPLQEEKDAQERVKKLEKYIEKNLASSFVVSDWVSVFRYTSKAGSLVEYLSNEGTFCSYAEGKTAKFSTRLEAIQKLDELIGLSKE